MPVTVNPKDSVLVVSYQVGVSSTGAPQIRQRSFQGIKSTATDQDVFDVAQALYGLQQYPLTGVRRDNRLELA